MMRAAMAFEWSKIRSLRSPWVCFAVALALIVGPGILTAVMLRRSYDEGTVFASFDGFGVTFAGSTLALVALVVFAVTVVTGEYATGSIRSSLAAVPDRRVFFGAKVLTATAVLFAVSTVMVLAGFVGTQAVLGEHAVSVTDESVPRALAGAVVYFTLLGTFSLGVAAVVRNTAAAVGLLTPFFLAVSTILTAIPRVGEVAKYLPDQAGVYLLLRQPRREDAFTPLTGLAVLVAWTAVALAAGWWSVHRRDP